MENERIGPYRIKIILMKRNVQLENDWITSKVKINQKHLKLYMKPINR